MYIALVVLHTNDVHVGARQNDSNAHAYMIVIQVLHGYMFDDEQPGAEMRLSITFARDQ